MITDSDPEVQDKLGPYSVIISFSALFKKKKKRRLRKFVAGGKKTPGKSISIERISFRPKGFREDKKQVVPPNLGFDGEAAL